MASKSNAFGHADFTDWTDWEIKQFIKIAKQYFGSEHFNYYIDFEDQISDKVFKVHGEGKWHIKSTLLAIKEFMLDCRISKDDLEFMDLLKRQDLTVKFTWLDEEGSLEWLEESKGELHSLGNTFEYNVLWEKPYAYTRTNLRKFDLYDEFEVDEKRYAKVLREVYPGLTPQIYSALDAVIEHNPHASEARLDELVADTLESLDLK